VAEQRGNQRPSGDGSRRAGRPSGGKPTSGKPPAGKKPEGQRPTSGGGSRGSAKSSERSQRWSPDSDRRDSRPARSGDRQDSRPARGGDRPGRKSDWKRPADNQAERTAEQARYDGPDLPEDITGQELDRSITGQLKGLPEKLASRVARHMAAAGMLLDEDPETAYQHTLAARARAPRLAVVREATGEAAYAAGHYAEALAELRAAKRMNGATAYLPIMADCHRALGKPEEALKLAKSPSVANFIPEAKAEMTIVEAGARRDLGQLDAALRTLELAPLTSNSRASWVAGRDNDALTWFQWTHAIDSDELTDADERAAALEKRLG
jgi:tetratricopeptide (TPR) repeat protein